MERISLSPFEETTLALAGVFQGIRQVIRISETAYDDQVVIKPLISSLLKLDADTVIDIYGDLENLRPGLTTLQEQLTYGANGRIPQLGRYVASVLNLERQLVKHSDVMTIIAARITHIKRLAEHADLTDDVIIKAIADLYTDTISKLPLRIQVVGKTDILKQAVVQEKIRTALFCAIRSAVLWRQLGGKRRQLLLNRKYILSTTEDILTKLNTVNE